MGKAEGVGKGGATTRDEGEADERSVLLAQRGQGMCSRWSFFNYLLQSLVLGTYLIHFASILAFPNAFLGLV
jgi:hypothetical protein